MTQDLTRWRQQVREGRAPAEGAVVQKQFASEVKVLAPATRQVRFRITTGNPDRMKDVIDPKGWDLAAYRKNPVVLFGHQYDGLPIGKAVEIAADDQGLLSTTQFATPEQYAFADTVYQLILGGFLNTASVGFRPLKFAFNEERGGIDFLEQELLEYSVVPVPANAEALVQNDIDLGPMRSWLARASKAKPECPEPQIVLVDDDRNDFLIIEPEYRASLTEVRAALEDVVRGEVRRQVNRLRGRVD